MAPAQGRHAQIEKCKISPTSHLGLSLNAKVHPGTLQQRQRWALSAAAAPAAPLPLHLVETTQQLLPNAGLNQGEGWDVAKLPPGLRCSNSIFWRKSGDIPVNSSEMIEERATKTGNPQTNKQTSKQTIRLSLPTTQLQRLYSTATCLPLAAISLSLSLYIYIYVHIYIHIYIYIYIHYLANYNPSETSTWLTTACRPRPISIH